MGSRLAIWRKFASPNGRSLAPLGSVLFAFAPLAASILALFPTDSRLGASAKIVPASYGRSVSGAAPTQSDCTSCHSFDPMFSHPVNIASTPRTPDLLPLENGRITCATCHDTDALRGHENHPARDDPKIRGDIPVPTLCSECHESGLPGSASSHASGLTIAHLPLENRSSRPATAKSSLDTESRGCMGCHDGTAASDAGLHTGAKSTFSPERDHPVGVPYSGRHTARPGSDEIQLVDVNSLDKRIRLFGGQIGCGSCHSVYSKESKLLVMTTLKSKLCFGCHVE